MKCLATERLRKYHGSGTFGRHIIWGFYNKINKHLVWQTGQKDRQRCFPSSVKCQLSTYIYYGQVCFHKI